MPSTSLTLLPPWRDSENTRDAAVWLAKRTFTALKPLWRCQDESGNAHYLDSLEGLSWCGRCLNVDWQSTSLWGDGGVEDNWFWERRMP